jgi:hypothetical protein
LVNEALRAQPPAELKDEGEDPDDWLNVDPMDLDHTLKQYHQQKESPTHGSVDDVVDEDEDMAAHEQAGRLKELAKRMEGFVEGEGAMEGALFDE